MTDRDPGHGAGGLDTAQSGGFDRVIALSALSWAFCLLIGLVFLFLLASDGFTDVYDRTEVLRALEEHRLLMVGAPVAHGLSGAALMFVVAAYRDRLSPEDIPLYRVRAVSGFGVAGSTLFMSYGLVTSWTRNEFLYLQDTFGHGAVNASFLPLTLVTNRMFAAAISVAALWLLLVNLDALKCGAGSRGLALLGIASGVLGATGFLLPGGGLGLVGLVLAVFWGTGVGTSHLRLARYQPQSSRRAQG